MEGLAAGEDPPGPQRYEAAVQQEICRELNAAAKIGAVVYALPRFAYRMMQRRPGLIGNYFQILRGEGSFVELWRRWRMAGGIELFRSLFPRLPGSQDGLVVIEDDQLAVEPRRPGGGGDL